MGAGGQSSDRGRSNIPGSAGRGHWLQHTGHGVPQPEGCGHTPALQSARPHDAQRPPRLQPGHRRTASGTERRTLRKRVSCRRGGVVPRATGTPERWPREATAPTALTALPRRKPADGERPAPASREDTTVANNKNPAGNRLLGNARSWQGSGWRSSVLPVRTRPLLSSTAGPAT